MKVSEWLAVNAEVVPSGITGDDEKVWVTKSRGDYIARVGEKNNALKDIIEPLGVTEYVSSSLDAGRPINIGFNPIEQKWYGWSHRAIYGFTIGSTCKKGDCHYVGSTLEEQEKAAIDFWADEYHSKTWCNGVIEQDGEKFFDIRWTYSNTVPNQKLRNGLSGWHHHIKPLGRGEWIAGTLADARQMAIDFAEAVS